MLPADAITPSNGDCVIRAIRLEVFLTGDAVIVLVEPPHRVFWSEVAGPSLLKEVLRFLLTAEELTILHGCLAPYRGRKGPQENQRQDYREEAKDNHHDVAGDLQRSLFGSLDGQSSYHGKCTENEEDDERRAYDDTHDHDPSCVPLMLFNIVNLST